MHHREFIRAGQCSEQSRPIPQAYERYRQGAGLSRQTKGLARPVQGGDDNAPEHAARIPGRPNHAGALRWCGPKVFLEEHRIAVGARFHFATDVVRCVVMVGRNFR
jgi:hypothetical protein